MIQEPGKEAKAVPKTHFNVSTVEGMEAFAKTFGMEHPRVTVGDADIGYLTRKSMDVEGVISTGETVKFRIAQKTRIEGELIELVVDGRDVLKEMAEKGFEGTIICPWEYTLPTRQLSGAMNDRNIAIMNAVNPRIFYKDNAIVTYPPVSAVGIATLVHEFGHGVVLGESQMRKDLRRESMDEYRAEYKQLIATYQETLEEAPLREKLQEIPVMLGKIMINRLGLMIEVLEDEATAWRNGRMLPSLKKVMDDPETLVFEKYVLAQRIYAYMPDWYVLNPISATAGTFLAKMARFAADNMPVFGQNLNNAADKGGKEFLKEIMVTGYRFGEGLVDSIFSSFLTRKEFTETMQTELKLRIERLKMYIAKSLTTESLVGDML
jgi:hypothetical protein